MLVEVIPNDPVRKAACEHNPEMRIFEKAGKPPNYPKYDMGMYICNKCGEAMTCGDLMK